MMDFTTKNEIREFLKRDVRLYSYEKNLDDKLENNSLAKEFYEHLLGFLLEYCISSFDRISTDNEDKSYNREEFQSLFQSIQMDYDTVPKWNGFSAVNRFYEPGTLKDIEEDNLLKYLETCLSINKRLDDIEDTVAIRRRGLLVIDSIKSIKEGYADKNILANFKEISTSLENELKEIHTPSIVIEEKILQYNALANKIWQNYLNKEEGYLVHNCSKGEFDIKDLDQNYNMSTSLITPKTVGLFKSMENIYFGFILKPLRILAAMEQDIWAHNNPDSFNGELFLSGRNRSIVKLPWQIEEKCIQKTVEMNGEILKYENIQGKNYFENTVYSEILLQGFDIHRMFYISYGEGSLSLNYTPAKNMADSFGIPLEEIDISLLRKKQGLESMTVGMKQRFLRNFLLMINLKDSEIKDYFKRSIYSIPTGIQDFEDRFVKDKSDLFYEKYNQLETVTSLEAVESILKSISTEDEIQQLDLYFQQYRTSYQI